jgi:integrase
LSHLWAGNPFRIVDEIVAINKLSAGHLARRGKFKLGDGGGLWLFSDDKDNKRWVFRYRLNGKDREMGLGSVNDISLAEARSMARECRNLKAKGVDPINHRQQSTELTFKECANRYIQSNKSGWKNPKHVSQWINTLETYADPVIGNMPVSRVDTALVMQILEPIWSEKNETASRLRGRIENVLSWAIVHGYHPGANPALWRGHLDKLLPKPTRVHKVRHHPAMPYSELPAFMGELGSNNAMSALALRFAILSAARTGEVIGADWSEINLDDAIWIVPEDRMKAGIEHRIPLSSQAVDILKETPNRRGWVFESANPGKPISQQAMLMLLRRKRPGLTVHGFRSSFRDWCGEQTNYPRELAESALAHRLKDKAEAAYQRGDMLERRRELMQAWADFCLG